MFVCIGTVFCNMNLQSVSQTPWLKCVATKTQTLRAAQFVLLRTNAFLTAGVDNFRAA